MRKVAQFNPEYAVIDDITGTKANGEKKPTFQLRRIKFCGRGEKWLVKRKVRVLFACDAQLCPLTWFPNGRQSATVNFRATLGS